MPGRNSKLRSCQLNQGIYSDIKVRLNAFLERERQHGEVLTVIGRVLMDFNVLFDMIWNNRGGGKIDGY
jgi:hypothetical protein